MHEYELSGEEGVVLMSLAEALLCARTILPGRCFACIQ